MPKTPGPPLRKVTLNLYAADCAMLETTVGWGWSEVVRDLVHDYAVQQAKQIGEIARKPTLEDLADGE